jgi:hypothetical protein
VELFEDGVKRRGHFDVRNVRVGADYQIELCFEIGLVFFSLSLFGGGLCGVAVLGLNTYNCSRQAQSEQHGAQESSVFHYRLLNSKSRGQGQS